jgi:murein DD-endopeptidase MepM/ murein hydrolase activator NlpD
MRFKGLAVAACVWLNAADHAAAAAPEQPARVGETKRRFYLNQADATQFCPPIRTAFADAGSTIQQVRGRTIVHEPNGGYGLPVREAAGRLSYHTGADIGWQRQGEAVYAVADGVVRISRPALHAVAAEGGGETRRRVPMDFGNLIVVEHRLADGRVLFSLYGHLAEERLVSAGDLVMAGQQIGAIGRKSPLINGGYDPHLHFGVKEGDWFRSGQLLLTLRINGQDTEVRLREPGEEQAEVSIPGEPPGTIRVRLLTGEEVSVTRTDNERYMVPGWLLYTAPHATGFPGYASRLDGWHDPIAFLSSQGAAASPAPFYHVTPTDIAADQRRNTLGEAAPAWEVDEWVRPAATLSLGPGDFAGRVIVLFCVDAGCPGSQRHGLPALARLAQHYRADPDVAVVGLLTPTTANRANSLAGLRKLAEQLPGVKYLGRCAGRRDSPPAMIENCQICGTPWVVLIDREGNVQFSNYVVRAEEIMRRAAELKDKPWPAMPDMAPDDGNLTD